MNSLQMKYEAELLFDSITNQAAPGYTSKEWSALLTEAQEELIKKRLNPKGNKYLESFEQTEKRAIDFAELIKTSVDIYNNSTTSISTVQSGSFSTGVFWDLPEDFFYSINEVATTDLLDCSKVGETQTVNSYDPVKDTIPIGSEDSIVNVTVNGNNIQMIAYTEDVPYYVKVPIKPITHDYYNSNFRNPFKKPYLDTTEGLVWRLKHKRLNYSTNSSSVYNYKQKHELITDGTFNITNYWLRYLRKPIPIIIPDANDTTSFRGYPMTTAVNCELSEEIHPEIIQEAVTKAAGIVKDQAKYQINQIESQKSE